jgi:hypothetical protein
LTPWLLLAGLFYTLRRLEVWLHQHIFKVGWLVTKQYQTTTILYYAFFLPGILLNQIVYWSTAGFLNVHAERSIVWPEKQEIGELKLSFVRLTKNVSTFRLTIIASTPLIVGLLVVWHIAVNVLSIPVHLASFQSGAYGDLTSGLARLTSAPDFWLWLYLAFTISNTMMPNFALLRGWRVVIVATGVIVVVLFLVGVGNQVILTNLQVPVSNALSGLSTLFAIIIGIDLFFLAVLGTVEAVIERITGNSATFENGKMITLSRAELQERRIQAQVAAKRASTAEKHPQISATSSVYQLPFPIPEPPGREAVTRTPNIVITNDDTPDAAPALGSARQAPAVVSGKVTDSPPQIGSPAERKELPPQGSSLRPSLPAGSQPSPFSSAPRLDKPAQPATGIAPKLAATAPLHKPPQPSTTLSPLARPALTPASDEPQDDDEDFKFDEDEDDGNDDVTYEDFEDPA